MMTTQTMMIGIENEDPREEEGDCLNCIVDITPRGKCLLND